MKTTIEIPDALAAEAKDVARAEGSTLRELVLAGLRREVEVRTRSEPTPLRFPTVDGDGLRPEVAAEQAVHRSYDLPA